MCHEVKRKVTLYCPICRSELFKSTFTFVSSKPIVGELSDVNVMNADVHHDDFSCSHCQSEGFFNELTICGNFKESEVK